MIGHDAQFTNFTNNRPLKINLQQKLIRQTKKFSKYESSSDAIKLRRQQHSQLSEYCGHACFTHSMKKK